MSVSYRRTSGYLKAGYPTTPSSYKMKEAETVAILDARILIA